MDGGKWVADTGRFSDFLQGKESDNLEVEPFPDGLVGIGRGAIVDFCKWKGKPLRGVK